MPFKYPEAKRAWRESYRMKQRAHNADYYAKECERLRPEREAAQAIRIAKREAKRDQWRINADVALCKWAIKEVRRRIMSRDGLKRCSTCKTIKPLEKFPPSRRGKEAGSCTQCRSAAMRDWVKRNPEKMRDSAKRATRRIKADPTKRLASTIRQCIQRAIKRMGKGVQVKRGKLRYLGCTPMQARTYIEQQMNSRMTWMNYGRAWQIDHVHPLASFDLSQESERVKAFHYTNLQPLWARANLRKNDRITKPCHQTLLNLPRQ